MKYQDEAAEIWQALVPKSGQADTVQGELLRAIEKLRDEARRNGNANWDKGFESLRKYLEDNLGKSDAHTFFEKRKLNKDIKRLADYNHPYTNDDLYDRLTDALVEWNRKHPTPINRN
jgi:hypothetical protein